VSAKRARARETTDAGCQAYVEARRSGATERRAESVSGVSRDAVRRHPVYGPEAVAAHEEYIEGLRALGDRIARGEVEDPQQARVMLAAVMWIVSKRDRENFGDRQTTDLNVTATSDETALRLAAAIAAKAKGE